MEDIALGFGAGIITVLILLEVLAATKRMNFMSSKKVDGTSTNRYFMTAFKEEDFDHFIIEHFGGPRKYAAMIRKLELEHDVDPHTYMRLVSALADGAMATHCMNCVLDKKKLAKRSKNKRK